MVKKRLHPSSASGQGDKSPRAYPIRPGKSLEPSKSRRVILMRYGICIPLCFGEGKK